MGLQIVSQNMHHKYESNKSIMRFVQLIKANHAQEFYDNNGIFANVSVTTGKGKEEKIDADSSVYHKQV